MNTPHDDALLTREDNAAALTAAGYKTSKTTLATLATRGGGPPFMKYGKHVVYRFGDSLVWAKGKLRPPVRSTSERPAVSL
jgi:hypothetical protein